ncbi:uncharacterized protein K489DRAFT_121155 [Dissoconium aciculare CBS 342.82]|uniref:DUF7136 domain-containing protein n=1 Tax=Dissoconium aciculare CBS 342.82 TaxID=1314786 RepID=A0A6J3MFK0_9PEZI|nr:uncharacterized protein K489DRAFT_121155 [Dissoconium aciculare CBS 342.82]KAF1826618.1 hypothetical protein K489DRAFT_121155 [Dissoconium aciculare CBS 342.82]
MNTAVSLFVTALLVSTTLAMAGPGTFLVHLVFPRNGTWAPTDNTPILFALQNPQLAASLGLTSIRWSLSRKDIANFTIYSNDLKLKDLNSTIGNIYVATDRTGALAASEGLWIFRWTLRYSNCSGPTDDVTYSYNSSTQGLSFATSISAPRPLVESVLSDQTCHNSDYLALNVTAVQDVYPVAYDGQPSCAVLGSSPTNVVPCAISINPALISSASAAVSYSACKATAASCALPSPTSGALSMAFTNKGLIWVGLTVLLLLS